MIESEENCLKFLDTLSTKYSDSVSNISKTGNNNTYVYCQVKMISLDKVKMDYARKCLKEEFSSVDGLHYQIIDNNLVIYLFEFKKIDFFEENLLAKDKLNSLIEKIKTSPIEEEYKYALISDLKEIKKDVYNKLLVQLKIKPLESLILIYLLYQNFGGRNEDIINIEKHYYVVSKTPEIDQFSKNKSKTRRKGKSKEIYDFLEKLCPFPFKQAKSINEKTFLELIYSLNN